MNLDNIQDKKTLRKKKQQKTLVIAIVLFLGVAVRLLYYFNMPVFITNDSVDYILLSEEIYRDLSLDNPRLGGIRSPIYPIFLTVAHFLTDFTSSQVVLLQILISFFSIGMGLLIGYLLRSFLVSVVLSFFLAFNPVYILNDHLVMSEGLFLFTLLFCFALSLVCFEFYANLLSFTALGLLFGICILTRSNGLFFYAPIAAGILLNRFVKLKSNPLPNTYLATGKLLLAFSIGTLVVVAPWLWRNYAVFGTLSPTNYTQRNLLVYQSVHRVIDLELFHFSKVNSEAFYDPNQPHTIYALIESLGVEGAETVKAEEQAGILVREQIVNHPMRYVQAVAYAVLNFGGYPTPNPPSYGRVDVESWFSIVGDIETLHHINTFGGWYEYTDFYYVHHGEDNLLTYLLSKAGELYLKFVRKIFFDIFIILWSLYIVKHGIDTKDRRDWTIFFLGLAYVSALMLHFITLSDYDRYTSPFDWIAVVVISLVISKLLSDKKNTDIL